MAVGQTWERQAPDLFSCGKRSVELREIARRVGRKHLHDHVIPYDDPDIGLDPAVDQGVLEMECPHEASSCNASASASTPTWQSAASAYSSGECETPVGLRTKSIAVGMPAAERMPAS